MTSPTLIPLHSLRYQTVSSTIAAHRERLEQVYGLWLPVWKATLLELDKTDQLPSDDFARQELWTSLFLGDACVGTCAYRKVDLNAPWIRRDSWFKNWTDTAYRAAQAVGRETWIGSNFTVHPDYRKAVSPEGVGLKTLLAGLTLPLLMSTPEKYVVGMTRKDRGMHQATYQWGARALEENGTAHGVPVDFIAYTQESLTIARQHAAWIHVENLAGQISSAETVVPFRKVA